MELNKSDVYDAKSLTMHDDAKLRLLWTSKYMRESWATHISHSKLNFTSFRLSLYERGGWKEASSDIKREKSSACWGCGDGRREKFISLILLFCVLCCFTLTLEAIPVTFDILNPDSIESVHYLHTALVLSLEAYSIYYNSYHIVAVVVTRNPNVDSFLGCCCCSPFSIWKQ